MEEMTILCGEKLSLTTPVPRDNDVVFPGENWFFYWKTGASLWEAKLQECPIVGKILVPINWAFHTDTGDQFDFADQRPETDLKKLVQIATKLGREVVFLLPISPAPFLLNGGVPHLLSRSLAISDDGLGYSILDSEKRLNKLYSFYDPRVFQAYAKFVKALGQYFSQKGIDKDIWGIECGYMEEGQFKTYFQDSSRAFEQAFGRFIQAKKEEKREADPNDDTPLISGIEDEKFFRHEFKNTIRNLYLDSAKAALNANWEGDLKYSFLSGDNEEFFNRLTDHYSRREYSEQLFDALSQAIVSSSVLIPAKSKGHILERQMEELVVQSLSQVTFTDHLYDEDSSAIFRPFSFVEVYQNLEGYNVDKTWQQNGLNAYLKRDFLRTFTIRDNKKFSWEKGELSGEGIHVVSGKSFDTKSFHSVLKLFMNGGKIIVDTSAMNEDFKRRLESFYLENSLNLEKLNYVTNVQNISLGEGRLVLLEGDVLSGVSFDKQLHFWERIFATFSIRHLRIHDEFEVDFSWRKRATSASELNYEEVRRLSFYNGTSYKKKMNFQVPKNFVLVRVIDQINVKVETTSHVVQVEMLPGASVSFDFGIYS